ncbi:unnamed protein product [Hyaloperonospora brassicae]|uniref:Uncharacterized protein n=1 Tax=Hyaloperonospora brassicae TaxID=162125 RepID=A0AAV0U628_HYABA|nr:unnamed protein product [Hyaloperonospora brassicae]
MEPKTTPLQEKHALKLELELISGTMEFKVSPPFVDTIIGYIFFKNDEMLGNAEDDDGEDLLPSDASKSVAKKIAKKSN